MSYDDKIKNLNIRIRFDKSLQLYDGVIEGFTERKKYVHTDFTRNKANLVQALIPLVNSLPEDLGIRSIPSPVPESEGSVNTGGSGDLLIDFLRALANDLRDKQVAIENLISHLKKDRE